MKPVANSRYRTTDFDLRASNGVLSGSFRETRTAAMGRKRHLRIFGSGLSNRKRQLLFHQTATDRSGRGADRHDDVANRQKQVDNGLWPKSRVDVCFGKTKTVSPAQAKLTGTLAQYTIESQSRSTDTFCQLRVGGSVGRR